MIRLSGKEPRLPGDELRGPNDVAVKFVGSRPGEKLHEELWGESESVGETGHPKIMRLSRPPVDAAWLAAELVALERLADEGDTLEVVAKLGSIVREPLLETAPATAATDLRPSSEASQRTEAPPAPSA
jgi:O-antigen biosynthesis protein WbqV